MTAMAPERQAVACESCGKHIADRVDGAIVLLQRCKNERPLANRIHGVVELECPRRIFMGSEWITCRAVNVITS